MPGVGFMARMHFSLSYLLCYGFFHICLMWRICSVSFQIFFLAEIVPCVAIGGKFRLFLHHCLELPSRSKSRHKTRAPDLCKSSLWEDMVLWSMAEGWRDDGANWLEQGTWTAHRWWLLGKKKKVLPAGNRQISQSPSLESTPAGPWLCVKSDARLLGLCSKTNKWASATQSLGVPR